ncbi:BrnA antitoxin family protein [Candidatus Uhrbacteria bacterium]|nr:BrnA antitoxin family protein [Candidatus Uhrbacteria bacterium]
MNKHKKIPHFKTEQEERKFWASHDSADYLDWSKAQHAVFPNLKTSTRTISIRLPEDLLARIQSQANQRDVPYQSYIKVILAESMDGKKKPLRHSECGEKETADRF